MATAAAMHALLATLVAQQRGSTSFVARRCMAMLAQQGAHAAATPLSSLSSAAAQHSPSSMGGALALTTARTAAAAAAAAEGAVLGGGSGWQQQGTRQLSAASVTHADRSLTGIRDQLDRSGDVRVPRSPAYKRSRLSPQMDALKRRMLEWLQQGKDKQTVEMFRGIMREGMATGEAGARQLPPEYRPDGAMLDEYYRALSRLHRMTDMLLQDDRAAQARDPAQPRPQSSTAQSAPSLAAQCAADMQEALTWSKAAGHVPAPTVYSQLIRACRRSGQIELMEPVLLQMKAAGHTPNMMVYLHFVMAHIEAGNLTQGWSMLEAMLTRNIEQQQAAAAAASTHAAPTPSPSAPGAQRETRPGSGSGFEPDSALCGAAVQVLQRAARAKSLTLANDVRKRLAELGVKVQAAAFEQCMVAAALDDNLDLALQFLSSLASCAPEQQPEHHGRQPREDTQEAASPTPPRVQEGSLLAVMHAALREEDHQAGLKAAQTAFEFLQRVAAVPQRHPSAYYRDALDQPVPINPPAVAPSVAAHMALLHAHVLVADWEGAFKVLHMLELNHGEQNPGSHMQHDEGEEGHDPESKRQLSGGGGAQGAGRQVLSPFHGLRFFCEALTVDEAVVAAAYDELSLRHARGDPVTTPMLNLVLRALAGVANGDAAVDSTGRLFEEFEAAGLQHDVDSYNAVVEACVRAKKLAAVQSLVQLMASGQAAVPGRAPPPPPNDDTWDLLLRAYIGEEDCDGILVTLTRIREANGRPRVVTLRRAVALAERLDHRMAAGEFAEVLERLTGGGRRRQREQ